MCLDLISTAELQVATEDIVVYKHLKKSYPKIIDGCDFSATIDGQPATGKVHYESGSFYFCTNNSSLDGESCCDKLGFEYSWCEDEHIEDLKVKLPERIRKRRSEKSIYKTSYQNFPIEIGKTYESELVRVRNTVFQGLHSFERFDECKRDIGCGGIGRRGIYAECIIPAGSKYYKGKFLGASSFASDKLKYVKIID